MNFKIGDFVYFSTSNKDTEKIFSHSGMILNISNGKVSVLDDSYTNCIYNMAIENIRPLSDKETIVSEINIYYDNKINELQSQIKSVERKNYKDEIVEKYLELKQEIINTAKHMQ